MVLGTLTPVRPMRWWSGALLATAFTVLAGACRTVAGSLLSAEAPYLAFIAAVLLSAVVGGLSAGAVASVLGGLVANWRFVGTPTSLEFSGSHLWDLVIFLVVSGSIVLVAGTMSAALRREAKLADELAMVSREYKHRVINVLTVAEALARQTGRHARTAEEFQRGLLDRLQALARAQSLLLEKHGQPVPLAPLVDKILSPYNIEARLDGIPTTPDVKVHPSHAVTLALLLNELATNATKYGSLSVPEGRLRLTWLRCPRGVTLTWKELQGPPVTPPQRTGFGSKLFKAGFAQSGGSLDLNYEPDGLRCQMRLPCI
jgi:two-component sensor histidine kinase